MEPDFTQKLNITTDTHVYFYTNWLSNFKISPFVDRLTGVNFNNTEQAFMWYKADFHKDFESRSLLDTPMHPAEAKKIGRGVKNYNEEEWSKVRLNMMYYVNFLKFSQSPELKLKLIETGNRTLAEASAKDNIWGVGFYAYDPLILDENNWTGQNLLGKALMLVRTSLIKIDL